jgi:hypothetical protein
LVLCLALALAGSGLTGWLHPAAAADATFQICSADGTRPADTGTGSGKLAAHDCTYCSSAPASGTAQHTAAHIHSLQVEHTPRTQSYSLATHRHRLNAEPRAPPAVL